MTAGLLHGSFLVFHARPLAQASPVPEEGHRAATGRPLRLMGGRSRVNGVTFWESFGAARGAHPSETDSQESRTWQTLPTSGNEKRRPMSGESSAQNSV